MGYVEPARAAPRVYSTVYLQARVRRWLVAGAARRDVPDHSPAARAARAFPHRHDLLAHRAPFARWICKGNTLS